MSYRDVIKTVIYFAAPLRIKVIAKATIIHHLRPPLVTFADVTIAFD